MLGRVSRAPEPRAVNLRRGISQWYMADEWAARVWCDGEEVTDRCLGVLMNGERPEAVDVLILNDRGHPFVYPSAEGPILARAIMRSVHIRVANLRRRTRKISLAPKG